MDISDNMKKTIVLLTWASLFLYVSVARSIETTLVQASVEMLISSFVIGLIFVSVYLMIQDK